jgi:hypothetical protein
MGYSIDESMVRVDFFKESGKWYATEAVKWIGYRNTLIYDAFENSLREHFKGIPRYVGMWAVCLVPYHEHSCPIMIKWEGKNGR